jgi:uncharacterized protein YkwD
LRNAAVVLVLAVLALCAEASAAETEQSRMIEAINSARSNDGLPPLRTARTLDRSAGAFARWLLKHETLTHRPEVSTRAYPHRGEALAMHYTLKPGIGSTIRSWLGSPIHHGLVMTRSMNMVGVGYASGRLHGRPRTVWVLQVARP